MENPTATPEAGNRAPPFPYAAVADYNTLREGDRDPESGKAIDYIVLQDRDFIVYLDPECYVHWGVNDDHYGKLCDGSGEVLNRVCTLESMPTDSLGAGQLPVFKKLIAEGVARLLGDKSIPQATQALAAAERWLAARNNEIARVWYLSASSGVSIPLAIAGFAFYLWRGAMTKGLGLNGTDLLLGACAGALGAWLSVATRLGQASLDVSAGRTSYYYEGVSKIMIGVLGAVVVAIAVKANVLLGALSDTQHPRALLLLLCMVSGASERMVPNLVGKVGGMFPGDQAKV